MNTLEKYKARIKSLASLIKKLEEASNTTKDNIVKILDYKDSFVYVDKSLERSFDAIEFFKAKIILIMLQ